MLDLRNLLVQRDGRVWWRKPPRLVAVGRVHPDGPGWQAFCEEHTDEVFGGPRRKDAVSALIEHWRADLEAEPVAHAGSVQSAVGVERGQVWADNDPRSKGRTVRVLRVEETYAVVTVLTARDSAHDAERQRAVGAERRIRLARFTPTSTGYRLVTGETAAQRHERQRVEIAERDARAVEHAAQHVWTPEETAERAWLREQMV